MVQLLIGMHLLCCGLINAQTLRFNDLETVSDLQKSQTPLTTEMIWDLDPEELNPHLQRWIIHREVDLVGLEARYDPGNNTFVIQSTGLRIQSTIYQRPALPPEGSLGQTYYNQFEEFKDIGCPRELHPHFSTYAGSEIAAFTSGQLWNQLLSEDKLDLSFHLIQIREPSASAAKRKATLTFQDWKRKVFHKWKGQTPKIARKTEWRSYLAQADSQQLCKQSDISFSKKKPLTPPSFVINQAFKNTEYGKNLKSPAAVMIRAPVKDWGGLFSIRINLKAGHRSINGQFLIDSSAPKSAISPRLLKDQGMPNFLIEFISTPFRQSLDWMIQDQKKKLTRLVHFESVEISGLSISQKEFLIYDSTLEDHTERFRRCCDGILGVDFLSKYVVEIYQGTPNELRIWQKKNFSPPLNPEVTYQWHEASVSENGIPVSVCTLDLSDKVKTRTLIHWHTGLRGKKETTKQPNNKDNLGRLVCSEKVTSKPFLVKQGLRPSKLLPLGPWDIFDLKLGDAFIFDLPHGKIWLGRLTKSQ